MLCCLQLAAAQLACFMCGLFTFAGLWHLQHAIAESKPVVWSVQVVCSVCRGCCQNGNPLFLVTFCSSIGLPSSRLAWESGILSKWYVARCRR